MGYCRKRTTNITGATSISGVAAEPASTQEMLSWPAFSVGVHQPTPSQRWPAKGGNAQRRTAIHRRDFLGRKRCWGPPFLGGQSSNLPVLPVLPVSLKPFTRARSDNLKVPSQLLRNREGLNLLRHHWGGAKTKPAMPAKPATYGRAPPIPSCPQDPIVPHVLGRAPVAGGPRHREQFAPRCCPTEGVS